MIRYLIGCNKSTSLSSTALRVKRELMYRYKIACMNRQAVSSIWKLYKQFELYDDGNMLWYRDRLVA
jgi:hypothetical protein